MSAHREAIRALVERVQRGGPSNILDRLDLYMSAEAAVVVRMAMLDPEPVSPGSEEQP